MTYVGRDARSGPGMTIGKAGMTGLKPGMIESIGMTAGRRSVGAPEGIAVLEHQNTPFRAWSGRGSFIEAKFVNLCTETNTSYETTLHPASHGRDDLPGRRTGKIHHHGCRH